MAARRSVARQRGVDARVAARIRMRAGYDELVALIGLCWREWLAR
ncbi:hypothetical protein [Nocardia sp. NPDC005998]